MKRSLCGLLVASALALAPATNAYATDGHFLHGVGAINSAMGGAGVAMPSSLLGTFYLNPAGLTAFEGTRIEFGFELFKPDRTVSSSAGIEGSTTSKSDFIPIPAMAFTTQLNERVTIGLGGLGIGGFGVDYPADETNPILGPRPNGFGEVFSNYSYLKFTPTVAYTATDKLSLGFSVNVDWASLQVDPIPVAAPAVDPGPDGQPGTADDRAFYSRGTATDGAFGAGFHVGMLYDVNEKFAFGASYSSPQWFEDFTFNSVWENPNLDNFGMAREIEFGLDIPAFATAGIGYKPTKNVALAADVRYIFYENTDGFEMDSQPFTEDGAVTGFGWNNIWVVALGGEYQFKPGFHLRGGYNYSQHPIDDELSFFNVPAPAIVQHHLTAGVGIPLTPMIQMDLGYYHAFNHDCEGPFYNLQGPIPGTSVKSEMDENSFLMQFSFTP